MNKIKFTKKIAAIMAASMLAVTGISATVAATTAMTAEAIEAPMGSIMLDTAQYTLAPGNQYTIGAFITDPNGNRLSAIEVKSLVDTGKLKVSDSRTGSIIDLKQLSTGHFQITAKNEGSCYVVYDIGGTHASVRVDVKKGVKQAGSAVRNTSVFTSQVFSYGPSTYTPSTPQITVNPIATPQQTPATTTPTTTTQQPTTPAVSTPTTTTRPSSNTQVKFVDVMEVIDGEKYDWNDNGKGHFTMATEDYTDGYIFNVGTGSFNLKGQYETLEFDLGHIDNSGSDDAIFIFYGDGIVIDTIDFGHNEMPKHFVVDVKDVNRLTIQKVKNNTQYGMANMMLNTKATAPLKTNNPTILNRHTHDGVYLYNGITAFDTSGFEILSSIISNGERYVNVVNFTQGTKKAVYNLKGEYKTLEFDLALFNLDRDLDIELTFTKDGVVDDVITMNPSDLAEHHSIDVRGVKQLIIQRTDGSGIWTDSALANAILYR